MIQHWYRKFSVKSFYSYHMRISKTSYLFWYHMYWMDAWCLISVDMKWTGELHYTYTTLEIIQFLHALESPSSGRLSCPNNAMRHLLGCTFKGSRCNKDRRYCTFHGLFDSLLYMDVMVDPLSTDIDMGRTYIFSMYHIIFMILISLFYRYRPEWIISSPSRSTLFYFWFARFYFVKRCWMDPHTSLLTKYYLSEEGGRNYMGHTGLCRHCWPVAATMSSLPVIPTRFKEGAWAGEVISLLHKP